MTMFRTALRATLLAAAITAAIPTIALADATLSIQSNRHNYVYYRDHDIYYSPETKTYYWQSNGTWTSGTALPPEDMAYVKSGGVKIELDTVRPYERHDYVIAHYKTKPMKEHDEDEEHH